MTAIVLEQPGVEPYLPLQQAVITKLKAHATLDEVVGGRIVDHVAEDLACPYVVWNTAWDAQRDTYSTTAQRVWFQIDVWSDYRGFMQAAGIANLVVKVLHRQTLRVPGHGDVQIFREQSHETRDRDGRHRRVAVTFHCPWVPNTLRPEPPVPPPGPGGTVVYRGLVATEAELPASGQPGDLWHVGPDEHGQYGLFLWGGS